MAYDSVRAQLDKLLGPDRNGPLTAVSTIPTDYRHPEICKNYLLGFCPNDLHIKHRSEPGSCRRRHSDSAKAAFEKDVAACKAYHEKARWTAALLSDCRAIIMDEDRKIRCHARRLKETYNAQGELSGLLIQSFDTLKKLGMVNRSAKIRVLSEIDDEEIIGNPQREGSDHEEKNYVENASAKGQSAASALSSDHDNEFSAPKSANGRDRLLDRQASGPSHGIASSEHDDASVQEDDDEGDDDFGLIKVIPAVKNTSKKPGKFEDVRMNRSKSTPQDVRSSSVSSTATAPDESKLTEKASTLHTGLNEVSILKKGDGHIRTVPTEKSSEVNAIDEDTKPQSVAKPDENSGHALDAVGEKPCAQDTSPDRVRERSGADTFCDGTLLDSRKKAKDGQRERETRPSMDEFYDRGVGPDGLLMLDRKQSLRVCACCGGYISLVDAESRLLSHYGGKSHHSLAVLRKKIPELEAQVSAESVRTNESSQRHRGDCSEERERRRSLHGSERLHSRERYGRPPERRYDRYEGRYGTRYGDRLQGGPRREGRGIGTVEWYNNSVRGKDDGYLPRHTHERSGFGGSESARYSSGRKRYRSQSPSRDMRRPRRHY